MKYLLQCFIFICTTFTLVALVSATDYEDTKISSEEEAIFAFFSANRTVPDYEEWIKKTHLYKNIPTTKRKEEYFLKESLRLGRGFSQYNLDRDLLELKTNIVAHYKHDEQSDKDRLSFRFFNLGLEKTPTFNYPFGENIISLIVDQLEKFADMELTEKNANIVRPKIPYINDDFDAELEIHARVLRADYDNPTTLGGMKQWIMFGQIGYLKCEYTSMYSGQTIQLWEYIAPWYEEVYELKNMTEEEKLPHPYDLFKD